MGMHPNINSIVIAHTLDAFGFREHALQVFDLVRRNPRFPFDVEPYKLSELLSASGVPAYVIVDGPRRVSKRAQRLSNAGHWVLCRCFPTTDIPIPWYGILDHEQPDGVKVIAMDLDTPPFWTHDSAEPAMTGEYVVSMDICFLKSPQGAKLAWGRR